MSKQMAATMRGLIAALLIALFGLGAVVLPIDAALAQRERMTMPERIAALRQNETRLIAIADRMAVAAAPWCSSGWSLGWILGDLGQYPKNVRATVRSEWQLPATANLFVAAVAPGSSTAAAGLTPGTLITAIEGEPAARHSDDGASRHALAANERRIDQALIANGGRVVIETLAADGTRREIPLSARRACASRFELSAADEKQAYADGSVVQVTLGMARFANDAELAGVVAHELAHNMLRHRLRSDAHGIPTNYTRHLGRHARVVRGMEEEADRLSVWLLAQAGFDPTAPVGFWHRFGPDNDTPHPFGRLHDPWRTRVAHLEEELATMRAARARNRQAVPALLDAIREVEAAEADGTRRDTDDAGNPADMSPPPAQGNAPS